MIIHSKFVCLNYNNQFGSEKITAEKQKRLCVPSVIVGDDPVPEICPEGEVLDIETNQCVPETITCPEGEVLDIETNQCVPETITCPEGQIFDTEFNQCIFP